MHMDDLSFQDAGTGDIEPIFELDKMLINTYEDKSAINCEKVFRWVRKKVETHIKEYKVVTLNGKKAGYYYFHETGGKMELDDFFVLPYCRGQGIGTAILNKCVTQTKLPIFLYVFSRNSGAISLYSRMGFSVVETIRNNQYIMLRK